MSKRLTKSMRDDILAKLITHRFDAEKTRLHGVALDAMGLARYEVLVEKCKSTALADDWVRLIEKAPDKLFPSLSGAFDVVSAGSYVRVNLGLLHLRVPYDMKRQYGTLMLNREAHPKACEALDEYRNAVTTLAEFEKTTRAKAEAALASFSTVEKLIDGWPEVKPFIPASAFEEKKLPVVRTGALNSLLDLPVDEKEAA